jgi:hypothetical protein
MPAAICLTPGCWTRINRGYVKRETLCLACRLDLDLEPDTPLPPTRPIVRRHGRPHKTHELRCTNCGMRHEHPHRRLAKVRCTCGGEIAYLPARSSAA